jgi:hypothetical protein
VPHHWVTGQNVQSIQQQSSNDMVSHPTRMWQQKVALVWSKIFLSQEAYRRVRAKSGCDRFQNHRNGYWKVIPSS